MPRLTERLVAARHAWSERTAASDEELRLLILADVGPHDADADTESNLSAIEQRVKALVDDTRLSERFLVVALIREIEDTLADWLADAEQGDQARGVLRVRAAKQRALERATPQERQSPAFQQHLRHFAAFERSIYPTPERVAQRKRQLETWRDVTRPLLESDDTAD
jgi:hypothetical protein